MKYIQYTLLKPFIFCSLLFFYGALSIAETGKVESVNVAEIAELSNQSKDNTAFIENKGQITQTDGRPAPYVSHILQRGNANIYLLREPGIAFQFNRTHYPEGYEELMQAERVGDSEPFEETNELKKDIRLETYRMDMRLVGADPKAKIITKGKSTDYLNYYTHDALNVHYYEKVIYKEVYPGIDWIIYTNESGGIKYDFELQPGADPGDIRLKFTHQEELYLDDEGNLIHGNRMGRFTEKAPESFQQGEAVHSEFILNDSTITFHIENYNPEMPLTIDPDRVWGTYYGGANDDYGYSCATDTAGNIYLVGSTLSNNNIASGGHQNSYGGDQDAFLVKFDSSGVHQWATYYGGSGEDGGYSCATDNSGNVYLAGGTGSTGNIASDGHQNTFGGGNWDAFLVKFNVAGVRQWGTYYGGSEYQWAWSCASDAEGNVYLAGSTRSTNNIASGGHQNTLGGSTDAFLVKFNASGVRQWGTYYGGSRIEQGYSCATDNSGNVYLAGGTGSTGNIASDGHQNTLGGGSLAMNWDAFLVKFNASGVRQWGTYYGGSEDDGGRSCTVDDSGNVFLSGSTASANNIASGGHQNTFGGSTDAFLVKFNASGVRQWGTYYGGSEDDGGTSCTADNLGNIFLAGGTGSTNNIVSDVHQNAFGGDHDAFLVKFNTAGVPQWGTYYGGSNFDYGQSCSIDIFGNLYLAGETESANNISFGGHQNNFEEGNQDAFLVKFQSQLCTHPQTVFITNKTATSAEIHWFDNSEDVFEWEIEYGTEGFVPGNGVVEVVNQNSYTLTNLFPNTKYDFYIRSNCIPEGYSRWNAHSFRTTPVTSIAARIKGRQEYKVFSSQRNIIVESINSSLIKNVTVFDASGRKVSQYRGNSTNRALINSTGLASGIYIVRIQNENDEFDTQRVPLTSR